MRTSTLIAGAAVAALTLAGCGSSQAPSSPTVTVTAQASPSVPATPIGDAAFMAGLNKIDPSNTSKYDEASLIKEGHLICKALDGGETVEDVLVAMLNGKIDPGFAGEIIGASAVTLCPSHLAEVKAFADTYGQSA